MEEYAYITPLLASAFYLAASARLLRLHRQTGERPELLLGVSFALWGIYYLGYNVPSLLRLEPWPHAIEWAFEWLYVLGVFPYMTFTRAVFRPDGAWASALVGICSACLLVGAAMGTLEGQVVYSLGNSWFIVEWVGYTTPCAWLCVEAMVYRHGARKRARLGLVEPLVVNRYLLLALFGGFQVLACLSDLSFAHDISSTQAASLVSNVLLGGTEIASVLVLWLAFFPLPFYANWIAHRAAIPPTSVEA